ncbi:hypothetical protein SLE2022_244140 [Rubroshorea leprosula]
MSSAEKFYGKRKGGGWFYLPILPFMHMHPVLVSAVAFSALVVVPSLGNVGVGWGGVGWGGGWFDLIVGGDLDFLNVVGSVVGRGSWMPRGTR